MANRYHKALSKGKILDNRFARPDNFMRFLCKTLYGACGKLRRLLIMLCLRYSLGTKELE